MARTRKSTREGALTPREQRFVVEFLKDLNITHAAIRAGYSKKTATTQGSRLFRKAHVQAAIADGSRKRAEEAEIETIEILREMARIATSDIRKAFDEEGRMLKLSELPDDIARAVSSVEVEQLFDGTGTDKFQAGVTVKLKLWDKNKALDMLGRYKKLFTDKLELNANVKTSHEDALGELE